MHTTPHLVWFTPADKLIFSPWSRGLSPPNLKWITMADMFRVSCQSILFLDQDTLTTQTASTRHCIFGLNHLANKSMVMRSFKNIYLNK